MINIRAESLAIMEREGGWSDAPPDPPTNWGISLPLWDEWCRANGQTFRTGKRALRASTRDDALIFYDWYFRTQGLAQLINDFAIPRELIPLVMDLRTQHSPTGCERILSFAEEILKDPLETKRAVIAASRIRYISWLAEKPMKHLRKDMRGLVLRALKAIGWWPIPDRDADVREV